MVNHTLILHSAIAKQLLYGRNKDETTHQFPINGLFQFAAMAYVIWQDAEKENPFAFWLLIRIERQLSAARDSIKKNTAWVNKILQDEEGFDATLSLKNAQTVEVDVFFSTPHAWQAMRLVKAFDEFFMQCRRLNAVGLVSNNDFYTKRREMSRLLVSAFNEAGIYQSYELIAQDLSPATETASTTMLKSYAANGLLMLGKSINCWHGVRELY